MRSIKSKIEETRSKKFKKKKGLQSVIRLNEFRKLWLGQILSQLADKFYIVLMVYLIAEFFINSSNQNIAGIVEIASKESNTTAQQVTLLATGIYIANTIPAIFFGTIAGIGADLWPKRKIMVISNTLKALFCLLIPLCMLNESNLLGIDLGYLGLLIITFIISSFTQFFAPAEQSAIPLLVNKDNLLAANSIYQATSMGTLIIGFSIGEPLINLSKQFFLSFGLQGGEFTLLPSCYAAAAIIIKTIKLNEKKRFKLSVGIWNQIIESLKVVQGNTSIRKAIIKLIFLYSLLATLYVITITLASSIESLGATKFGSLLAISGLGIATGAIALGETGDIFSLKKISSIGLGGITLSLLLLSNARGSLSSTLFLCFCLGISVALIAIPAQTTIHRETPENQRGKVFGLQNNLINIALTLPLVLAGGVIGLIGLNPLLWILAGVAFLAILLEKP